MVFGFYGAWLLLLVGNSGVGYLVLSQIILGVGLVGIEVWVGLFVRNTFRSLRPLSENFDIQAC